MIEPVIFWILISALVGIIAYIALRWDLEYTVLGTVVSSVLVFILFWVAWSSIKQDKLSYNEYWNGYEIQAVWDKIPCQRDGRCNYNYNCDPYEVADYHYSTDSDGKTHVTVTYHTEYHSCPYTTEEWDFVVKTTLGDYHIARNVPMGPDDFRFRAGKDVPDNLPFGIPNFWSAAQKRLDAGTPGPVTKTMKYDNYILASDQTILNQYSDKIQEFKDQGLLPNVASSVRDFYYADKVYFVGGYVSAEDWSTPVSYLNAGLGTELQGDLHLVIAQNIYNPNTYITALKAYWTDSTVFGDNTLSKNGIIVVLGTEDRQTIEWVRVKTGMPVGNEWLEGELSRVLVGKRLDVATVLGSVKGELYTREDGKVKARVIHGNGLLDRVLWGLDGNAGFKRVSMTANDADDVGSGFGYLADMIEPSEGQKFWINIFCGFTVLALVWSIAIFVWKEEGERKRGYYRPYSRRSIY